MFIIPYRIIQNKVLKEIIYVQAESYISQKLFCVFEFRNICLFHFDILLEEIILEILNEQSKYQDSFNVILNSNVYFN